MKTQLSKALTAVGISAVLVVGVGGFAYGATGGSFLLGKSNKAGDSTSLTNTGSGVALKLFTKSSLSAPFSTNAKGKVVNLYADRANTANTAANSTKLGGQTLSQVVASARPAALTCAQGGACAIGDVGPGNGTVFLDAGSEQPWGRYLEVAPNTWKGGVSDPTLPWCAGSVDPSAPVPGGARGYWFGDGWANTERTARYCDSGAAVAARGYHGGGKTDWYLPSNVELNALCGWAVYGRFSNLADYATACIPYPNVVKPSSGNFEGDRYWSSSESSTPGAAELTAFGKWLGGANTTYAFKPAELRVRPIRAF